MSEFYTCSYCGRSFNSLHSKHCHENKCSKNPNSTKYANLTKTRVCERCGKEYTLECEYATERFCSRSCANTRQHSLETKNKIANELISHTSSITYEEMNFKSLQKKAKDKIDKQGNIVIERSDKISTINGKQVHKCKKKKRFGKVLKNKSPAKFLEILKNKCKFYDIPMKAIHTQTYKASQYNHIENNYKKKGLNERWMYITLNKTNKDETIIYKVQRDLYSSFLIKYPNKEQASNGQ